MSQCNQIISYMREHKSITAMEAVKEFNCYRLAARISDIRGRGYRVLTKMEKTKDGKFYARYILA